MSLSSTTAACGDFFEADDDDCISWLDSRPVSSVVYICLGTVVQMKQDQLDEMAYGVLESGVCFLWAKEPTLVSAVELTAVSFVWMELEDGGHFQRVPVVAYSQWRNERGDRVKARDEIAKCLLQPTKFSVLFD